MDMDSFNDIDIDSRKRSCFGFFLLVLFRLFLFLLLLLLFFVRIRYLLSYRCISYRLFPQRNAFRNTTAHISSREKSSLRKTLRFYQNFQTFFRLVRQEITHVSYIHLSQLNINKIIPLRLGVLILRVA